MKIPFLKHKKVWYSFGSGGLSVYWSIIIGIFIVSAYLVGGLVPKRFMPPVQGQAISFTAPHFSKTNTIQMRSLTFQGCGGLPGVLVLMDASEQIRQADEGKSARKLDLLKSALLLFGSKLSDQARVGIMTYSDASGNDPKLRLPMGKLGDIRANYSQVVSDLDASGLVYIRNGMESAEEVLKREIANNPGYQYNLIVIANSVPRTAVCITDPRNKDCSCKGGNNCFAKDQDPTENPNVAKRLRDKGVKIYTVGLENYPSDDKAFTVEFENMLKKMASDPQGRHFRTITTAEKLSDTLSDIGANLCLKDADVQIASSQVIKPTVKPTATPTPRPPKATPTKVQQQPPVKPPVPPAQSVPECRNITVPGTSDPWLSGMTTGARASGGDTVPGQAPVASGIAIKTGATITFSNVQGTVTYLADGSSRVGPEGSGIRSHDAGGENGIANVTAPSNALLGIFVGPGVPSPNPAPGGMNFSTSASRNFGRLTPGNRTPFFIGDGKSGSGTQQTFIVPQGATRLFLGTMDGSNWADNHGAFTLRVCNGTTPNSGSNPGGTTNENDGGTDVNNSGGNTNNGNTNSNNNNKNKNNKNKNKKNKKR